jgi:hypothetical protein
MSMSISMSMSMSIWPRKSSWVSPSPNLEPAVTQNPARLCCTVPFRSVLVLERIFSLCEILCIGWIRKISFQNRVRIVCSIRSQGVEHSRSDTLNFTMYFWIYGLITQSYYRPKWPNMCSLAEQ